MRKYNLANILILPIAMAFLLGGCASGGAPKNADDFRQQVSSRGPFKIVDSFEVARPFGDVATTLRKKTDECLQVRMNWQTTGATIARSGTHTYKPTLIVNKNKAELHVQMKRVGGGVHELGAPPEGYYRVVLDAVAAGSARTKIDIYVDSIDDNVIRNALRGWAQGTNLGCPDVTRR